MTRHALMLLQTAILAACSGFTSPASNAGSLQPPPGFTVPVRLSDKDPHDCPDDARPYTDKLDFPSKYEGSDKARDDLNRDAEARYRRAIAPITALEKGFSQQVDDYMRSGRRESLACALGLLRNWSEARALEGTAVTHTGRSMRKWALASVASAYLRLKFSETAPLINQPALVAGAERWLGALAERTIAEWGDQPLKKVNNHEYWAAWAVMASAVALDRRDLFDWSVEQFRLAASQIDDDGYLPNELARDTRALYYHNYALTPLTMIAAFAKANGVDLTDANDHALQRLATRVLEGVDDPDAFEDQTGSEQNLDEFSKRSKFAWMEAYCWTVACDDDVQERMQSMRPLKSYRLGGNVSELFASPAVAALRTSRQESRSWMPPLA